MEDSNNPVWDDKWDMQLGQMGGHFLQSSSWAQFQRSLGREVYSAKTEEWMWSATKRSGRGIKYLMAAYGPTIAGGTEAALASLVEQGRKERADFVRFEPLGQASKFESTSARRFSDVEPSHTWVLDLTQDAQTLRAGVSASNRNLINTSSKRNLRFAAASDEARINIFLSMLADTAKHAGIKNYPDNYYRNIMSTLGPSGRSKLYLAWCGHQVVAGAIVYDFGSTRYYAHAASFYELNRQHKASVPLLWHLIMDAKSEGRTQFDFWGIAPNDDPSHPWAGITRFKKSFGGSELVRAGTWDIPLKPAKYRLYRLAKKLLPL